VEAQTDIHTYLEQGKQALAQGQPREAAIAYAHGAQMEPNLPMVHLGLAEANLALDNKAVVKMACQRVQELQPTGGLESRMAQTLLDLLDRKYELALQKLDTVIEEDPSIAYAHALRSYLLRVLKQDYDANLARARATRLSYGGHFEHCFPEIDPQTAPVAPSPKLDRPDEATLEGSQQQMQVNREVPTWSRPNRIQNQMIRTRFALSQHPGMVTNILIGLNAVLFLLGYLFPSIIDYGAQINGAILNGEVWRLFTSIFLHTDILHIALNMLMLFFIGRAVEIYFGPWRYLAIYILAGIGGGILFLFVAPPTAAIVGASGAIFGIFGALGVFYIANRRSMGAYAGGAIGQWFMWLAINIVFNFNSGVGLYIYLGGIVIGMIVSYVLLPRAKRRRAG
jgi:membrane associated rhomboid family serine protease